MDTMCYNVSAAAWPGSAALQPQKKRISRRKQTMKISKTQSEKELTIALEGRLDTVTAPELEKELKDTLDQADSLTLDFSGLEYISSAGLRVMLSAHKAMQGKGGMKIIHVNEIVREVFDVTGFSDILDIA
jgi:anti-sigma B factor antagonist